MIASKMEGQTTGGKRTILANVIPLNTPYLVQIFPVYACNFKCKYCIHSVPYKKRSFISNQQILDYDLYKKCIDDLTYFPKKIKMLRFAATGEPLLHPQLPEMIDYAKRRSIANSIDIVTNGSLLTPILSESLIDAGLDWLRISIQGVSEKRYYEVSGVNINMDDLVDRITYFFENKGKTKVYIKTINIDMDKEDKKLFYKTFESICDKISIENLAPATSHINYYEISHQTLNKSQNGNPLTTAEVCPQPFYMIQINPDGNAVPCCAMETATVIGNIRNESVVKIWRGEPLREFRKMMLEKKRENNVICTTCVNFRYGMFKEDLLDEKADLLLQKIYK
ncbi:radical SAM/SPASM domain-containing protein [Desulfopila sp. IMCC35008]|uniref:radical SAM/SPASM domain-containing protein n=1 Tax=Desulfopila sp. IMCC35008 TaxID=2653858 RepID=UPI0013D7896B|nr:radical SAM/SPASM domain-containing protein [Desulfopila sp. IMCC35008]